MSHAGRIAIAQQTDRCDDITYDIENEECMSGDGSAEDEVRFVNGFLTIPAGFVVTPDFSLAYVFLFSDRCGKKYFGSSIDIDDNALTARVHNFYACGGSATHDAEISTTATRINFDSSWINYVVACSDNDCVYARQGHISGTSLWAVFSLSDGSSPPPASVAVGFDPPSGSNTTPIQRSFAMLSLRRGSGPPTSVMNVTFPSGGQIADGLTEQMDGSLTGTLSPTGSGNEYEARYIEGSDLEFDLNMDGRVNQVDVDDLYVEITSTDPDLLVAYDFTQNGVIDSDDVDVFQSIIDAGFDAGVLGDIDGDGDADCDDLDEILGYTGGFPSAADPNDADYFVALDVDLDGDLDNDDKLAVYLAIQPADWLTDGSVNSSDWLYFLNLYSMMDPRADLNNDTFFNSTDTLAYLGLYSAACP
jgi:hypothetical protein